MFSRFVLRCVIAFMIFAVTGGVIYFVQDDRAIATSGNVYDTQYPIVRFHVVAHSNAPEDQYYKLRVRDRIMRDFLIPFSNQQFQSVQEAAQYVQSYTPFIENIVQEQLTQDGVPYNVNVQLGLEQYEARPWAGTIVPQGEYIALRVVLGAGRGENFWCIIFPTICFVPEEVQVGTEETKQMRAQRMADHEFGKQFGLQNIRFRWRVWERVSQTLFGDDDNEMRSDSLAARPHDT